MYHFTEKPSIKTLKTIFQVPLSQHKTVTTQITNREKRHGAYVQWNVKMSKHCKY